MAGSAFVWDELGKFKEAGRFLEGYPPDERTFFAPLLLTVIEPIGDERCPRRAGWGRCNRPHPAANPTYGVWSIRSPRGCQAGAIWTPGPGWTGCWSLPSAFIT